MFLARVAVAGFLALTLSGCLFGPLRPAERYTSLSTSDVPADLAASYPPSVHRPARENDPLANGQRGIAPDEDVPRRVATHSASGGVQPFASLARAETAREHWQVQTASDLPGLTPPPLMTAKTGQTPGAPNASTPAALIP